MHQPSHTDELRRHAPGGWVRYVAALSVLAAAACSDPPQGEADAGATDSGGTVLFDSGGGADGVVDSGGGDSGGTAGEGVWLTFEVDDSANKTFADGDIKWTGSFSWDSKTNEITYATSWLPTDGPYPLLYDDGPISKGGHEHEQAKAGDHVFSTAVKFRPSDDTVIEYGALNEFDNWMWIGANGQLEVKKDATGTLAAKPLVLPGHGSVDLKLELDTAKLNAKFKTWTPKTHKFYAKGTMNMWTPVQLLDDGKKGDEAAGDGKLTYVQSQNLGKHDGLLRAKDEVQFVYVTTTGDQFPEAGQEYKGATEAHTDGIRAWTNTGAGGAWVEATVELRVDSKGKFKNTAIVVPEGGGTATCDPACKSGETCEAGKCVPKPCEPACKSGEVCSAGACVPKPCDPACKTGETCKAGTCVADAKPCTPACTSEQVCEAGQCVAKTCKPACAAGQKCVVDQCVDLPKITKVEPSKGPMAGGTKVTITGTGFAAPAQVSFGGKAATSVLVQDAKVITCESPAGTTGPVTVEVDIAGDKTSLDKAFTYDPPPKPTALLVKPLTLTVEEGAEVKGLSAVVKVPTVSQQPGPTADMTVEFGVGAVGSDPAVDTKWTWVKGLFSAEDTVKGEETWTADLGKLAIGTYAFTVRVKYAGHVVFGDSDGSEDGTDLKKLGGITVTKVDTTPTVTGFEPPYVPWTGGKVTILGKNLTKDLAVTLKSDFAQYPLISATDATVVPGKGVQVTFSAGGLGIIPPLPATLTATPKGVKDTVLPTKLDVVTVATPTLDGALSMKEWVGPILQAQKASEWTNNTVSQLYVAFDKTQLYVGWTGSVEAKNAIVAYVDVDYGKGTGVKSPVDLKDNTGALDDAVSNVLKVLDGSFAADFALGTVGMKSQLTGKPADSAGAGWRSLANVSDLGWLGGKLVAQSGKGVEASLPLSVLFPKGVPATGATVALFVKIVNGDGSVAPKDGALPDQKASDATTIDSVATVRVYPLP